MILSEKSATFRDHALGSGFSVSLFHGLGAGGDCLDDIVVAGAAAEIALELVPNGRVVEVVALAVDHVDGGHDHARGAIAALQPVMLAEGLLHRMQRPIGIGETLDGEHIRPLDLPDEYGARLHGLAVDMHDAGAALRRVAAHMGAGEPQVLAQKLHQQRARVDITGDGFTVHRQGDVGHGLPPQFAVEGLVFRADGRFRRRIRSNRRDFADVDGDKSTLNWLFSRDQPPAVTAAANFTKKSSAVFFAALLMRRCPSCASLPPICASTSYMRSVPPSLSESETLALPFANPATPPSPSPEIR